MQKLSKNSSVIESQLKLIKIQIFFGVQVQIVSRLWRNLRLWNKNYRTETGHVLLANAKSAKNVRQLLTKANQALKPMNQLLDHGQQVVLAWKIALIAEPELKKMMAAIIWPATVADTTGAGSVVKQRTSCTTSRQESSQAVLVCSLSPRNLGS